MPVVLSPAAFLAADRFALVGASRGGRKFGNTLLRELRKRDVSVIPIHPEARELEGLACVPNLRELPGDVDALVVCLPPARVLDVLRDAAGSGVRRIWLQPGAESPEVLALAERSDLRVVSRRCLLLHLEPVRGIHAFHRWVDRWLGGRTDPAGRP